MLAAPRTAEAMDRRAGRNRLRMLYDGDRVYVETWGNHDGVSVHTAVVLEREQFAAMVREMGVM